MENATGDGKERFLIKKAVNMGCPQPMIVTTPMTEPSTLTNLMEMQKQKQAENNRQGKQMDNLLGQITQMMEMMQQMFILMNTILMCILPDRAIEQENPPPDPGETKGDDQ